MPSRQASCENRPDLPESGHSRAAGLVRSSLNLDGQRKVLFAIGSNPLMVKPIASLLSLVIGRGPLAQSFRWV
jgi:hypothetical protein